LLENIQVDLKKNTVADEKGGTKKAGKNWWEAGNKVALKIKKGLLLKKNNSEWEERSKKIAGGLLN